MRRLKIYAACAAALITAALNVLPAAAARGKYVSMDLKYDGEYHYYNAEEIVLEINGREPDDLPMPPILLNNYTLVPAREVFEGLGAEVDWHSDSRQVQIFHENTTVVIKINSTTALVNGEEKEMDIPAKIINDKTMIPLRFVSQAIDKDVAWDGNTRTASVKDKIVSKTETTTEATTKETTTETTTTTTTKETTTVTETTTETTTAAVSGNSLQEIDEISFEQGLGVDMISISGADYAPNVNVTKSTDGKLITIDIENGTLAAAKEDFGSGTFIKNGYYYQLSQKLIRVTVELDSDVKYNVTKEKNETTVILSENTGGGSGYGVSSKDYSYVGNNFSFEENKLIINNSNGRIDFNRVKYDDDYLGGEITVTIPADLTSVITSTSFSVGNDDIQSVDINTNSYNTVITIHENRILAVKPESAGSYAVFSFVDPQEVYDKILVLDAGHGDHDNGATGNGLVEKELTLDIMLKTLDLFENDGEIKVYCTRLDDTFRTLWERQDMATELGDAFVSVHINSASTSTASGTETYCLYPNDQGNGLTSYMLAEAILDNIVDQLGTVDRGVKSNDYVVLKGTKPSTLIEVGFISNYDDAEIMASSANRQKVAQSIFSAVKGLFAECPPVR